MQFYFDSETHEYTVDDARKGSVTEILGLISDLKGIPGDVLEFARDRGTHVHKACELDDGPGVNTDTLDERLQGYVMAWRRFRLEWPLLWSFREIPMYSPRWDFAGTPDCAGTVTDNARKPIKNVIVDIKATAKLSDLVDVQNSGYSLLMEDAVTEMGDEVAFKADELWAVQLRPDGTYKRKVCEPQPQVFHSLLTLYNWKKRYA